MKSDAMKKGSLKAKLFAHFEDWRAYSSIWAEPSALLVPAYLFICLNIINKFFLFGMSQTFSYIINTDVQALFFGDKAL